MPLFDTLTALLVACNWHAGVYGAVGATLLMRAAAAMREREYEQAQELLGHAIAYLVLGLA